MAIEIIDGAAAYGSLEAPSYYPRPGIDGERYVPAPTPVHRPAFEMRRDTRIFTIGSCFARNVERALRNLDFNVISTFVEGLRLDENISNKYTTASILQDLKFALEGDLSDERLRPMFALVDETRYVNLNFGGAGALGSQPLPEMMALTRRYYETFARIKEADVVIVTLGLVEVWRDNVAGVFLNIAPPRRLVAANLGRYSLHVQSFDDIARDLDEMHDIIVRRCRPGVKFLCTVSPVPLHATFRGVDCMQANMYSKSVLRAAAEHFCAKYDDVTYFPSYEMVVMGAPSVSWVEKDFRHVRPEVVDRIMRKVIGAYVGEETLPPSRADIQSLIKAYKYREAVDEIDKHFGGDKLKMAPNYAQYYYGLANFKLRRYATARRALTPFVAQYPNHVLARRILDRLKI